MARQWHYCPHTNVREEPGEPTLGPYFVCEYCGTVFNSDVEWLRARSVWEKEAADEG